MVFPVVTYGWDSQTVKKSEHQRIDTFKLWCWERLLRAPWMARSNQSILRGINIEYSWVDAETEALVFWSTNANSWLIGKVPDAGKDGRQKEKRESKDEMAGWHHQCHGHELGQTSGDGEGQGGLICWSSWGHKESDMIGKLNNDNKKPHFEVRKSTFFSPILILLQRSTYSEKYFQMKATFLINLDQWGRWCFHA